MVLTDKSLSKLNKKELYEVCKKYKENVKTIRKSNLRMEERCEDLEEMCENHYEMIENRNEAIKNRDEMIEKLKEENESLKIQLKYKIGKANSVKDLYKENIKLKEEIESLKKDVELLQAQKTYYQVNLRAIKYISHDAGDPIHPIIFNNGSPPETHEDLEDDYPYKSHITQNQES